MALLWVSLPLGDTKIFDLELKYDLTSFASVWIWNESCPSHVHVLLHACMPPLFHYSLNLWVLALIKLIFTCPWLGFSVITRDVTSTRYFAKLNYKHLEFRSSLGDMKWEHLLHVEVIWGEHFMVKIDCVECHHISVQCGIDEASGHNLQTACSARYLCCMVFQTLAFQIIIFTGREATKIFLRRF